MTRSWHGLPSIEVLVESYRDHMFLGSTVKLSREEQILILDLYDTFSTTQKSGATSFMVDWDLYIQGKANPKMTAEDLKGMQGVPEVYISVTWTAITADQVEKVSKFAAELGVPFNMNMQDPIYGEDEDDGELTHD